MFSFFVWLKLSIISIFLDATVIACDDNILEIVIEEGSLNMLDILILTAWKDLISLLLTWAIILLGFSFIVSDMNISDMTIFMTEDLHLPDLAAEMLMTPFDQTVACALFHLRTRVTWLFAFLVWRDMIQFFLYKLFRLIHRLLRLGSPCFSLGLCCLIFWSALIFAL